MKKLLIFIAVLFVVIFGAVAALVLFVNPNQFKPLIVEQTKKQTGLDLVIEGDIGWQFFPSIGFELGKTALKNPEGFSSPDLFKVDNVGIDVSVMPLLNNRLEIGNVTLNGAQVNIERLKDGTTNLDVLTKKQQEQTTSAPEESGQPAQKPAEGEKTAGQEWSVTLGGINIINSAFEIRDDTTQSVSQLYDVNLSVSEFAFDQWSGVNFSAKGKTNGQNFGTQGKAEFNLSQDLKKYALRNIELEATYSDSSNKIDSAKLNLGSFEFNKVNALNFSVQGKAAEMDMDIKGSAALTVDQDLSQVTLAALNTEANLKGSTLPQSPMKITLASEVGYDVGKQDLTVLLTKLTANALEFDGKANVTLADIPRIRFNVHSPAIDVDEFLGTEKAAKPVASEGGPAAGTENSAPASASQESEPDLSALKNLDVAGTVTIDQFKASNARLQNVKVDVAVNRGMVNLKSFTSNLYQGSIAANAQLDARKVPAVYTVKSNVKGVKVLPLLQDLAGQDKLEGTGNITMDLKGSGLTPTGIKQNLAGTVGINFADGAVNGINVANLIRTTYAKVKGQKIDDQDTVKKTDFSAMTANLVLSQGVVTTNDLNMQSPLLRIAGEGKANYLKETVDFLVKASVVGTLEGQGGKELTELRNVTIPINVSGQWADPKFKLVFDDILKQKAQKEIDRGIEKLNEKLDKKIKDEKTREAVDGLLKGLFK